MPGVCLESSIIAFEANQDNHGPSWTLAILGPLSLEHTMVAVLNMPEELPSRPASQMKSHWGEVSPQMREQALIDESDKSFALRLAALQSPQTPERINALMATRDVASRLA
jgi:hypothetical protein